MSDDFDAAEAKRLKLMTTALAVVLLLIVGVIFVVFRSSPDEPRRESVKLSAGERAAASKFTSDFIGTSGTYGIADAAFSDVRLAFLTDMTQDSENFVSRAAVTEELAASFFTRNAPFNQYDLYQEPIGTPYRVTAEAKISDVPEDGFLVDGREAVAVNVDVTARLAYYGRGQGYLLDNGQPAPVPTELVTLTYADTGTVQLVKNNSNDWSVSRVDGLDKISVLAFQAPINFHDNIVVDMPNPVAEDRVDVQGAPPL